MDFHLLNFPAHQFMLYVELWVLLMRYIHFKLKSIITCLSLAVGMQKYCFKSKASVFQNKVTEGCLSIIGKASVTNMHNAACLLICRVQMRRKHEGKITI